MLYNGGNGSGNGHHRVDSSVANEQPDESVDANPRLMNAFLPERGNGRIKSALVIAQETYKLYHIPIGRSEGPTRNINDLIASFDSNKFNENGTSPAQNGNMNMGSSALSANVYSSNSRERKKRPRRFGVAAAFATLLGVVGIGTFLAKDYTVDYANSVHNNAKPIVLTQTNTDFKNEKLSSNFEPAKPLLGTKNTIPANYSVSNGTLKLKHTVKPGENPWTIYSKILFGTRSFDNAVRYISAESGLPIDKVLTEGQVIKFPLHFDGAKSITAIAKKGDTVLSVANRVIKSGVDGLCEANRIYNHGTKVARFILPGEVLEVTVNVSENVQNKYGRIDLAQERKPIQGLENKIGNSYFDNGTNPVASKTNPTYAAGTKSNYQSLEQIATKPQGYDEAVVTDTKASPTKDTRNIVMLENARASYTQNNGQDVIKQITGQQAYKKAAMHPTDTAIMPDGRKIVMLQSNPYYIRRAA